MPPGSWRACARFTEALEVLVLLSVSVLGQTALKTPPHRKPVKNHNRVTQDTWQGPEPASRPHAPPGDAPTEDPSPWALYGRRALRPGGVQRILAIIPQSSHRTVRWVSVRSLRPGPPAPIAAGATRATCASGGERPSRCPQADRGARARLAALLRPPEPRAAFIRNGVRRTPLVERFPTFRIFSLGLHTKERVLPVDRQWTARPRCRTRRRSASPGTGRAGTRRRCPGPGPAVDANIPGPGPWR